MAGAVKVPKDLESSGRARHVPQVIAAFELCLRRECVCVCESCTAWYLCRQLCARIETYPTAVRPPLHLVDVDGVLLQPVHRLVHSVANQASVVGLVFRDEHERDPDDVRVEVRLLQHVLLVFLTDKSPCKIKFNFLIILIISSIQF